MDNGYQSSGDPFAPYDNRGENARSGRGSSAFATIVIVCVLVLLALLIIGLFWPELLGGKAFTPPEIVQTTPKPQQNGEALPKDTLAPEATPGSEAPETEKPSLTPAVDDADRVMPELDGELPAFSFSVDNPIPDIYDAVAPGVVGVINYTQTLSERTLKVRYEAYGSGTGFVVSSSGYIVTNAHVVSGADKIGVKLDDMDEELTAKLIGLDEETDIAVLKVDGVTLSPLTLGDSDAIRVGEYVLAIGNPLDQDALANTITFGIISAKAREIMIDSYTNTYIQTDAAINFGNSGGPLLNMKGEVVGVNSAKTITAGYDQYGNAVAAEGIGFALPINQVKRIMETLIQHGEIVRPGIGVTVYTLDADTAEENGIPVVGAAIESVVKDRPAAKAGMQAGDIIVKANGEEIVTKEDLIAIVQNCLIGDTLHLTVYRDGAYVDLVLIIENKSNMDFDDIEQGQQAP